MSTASRARTPSRFCSNACTLGTPRPRRGWPSPPRGAAGGAGLAENARLGADRRSAPLSRCAFRACRAARPRRLRSWRAATPRARCASGRRSPGNTGGGSAVPSATTKRRDRGTDDVSLQKQKEAGPRHPPRVARAVAPTCRRAQTRRAPRASGRCEHRHPRRRCVRLRASGRAPPSRRGKLPCGGAKPDWQTRCSVLSTPKARARRFRPRPRPRPAKRRASKHTPRARRRTRRSSPRPPPAAAPMVRAVVDAGVDVGAQTRVRVYAARAGGVARAPRRGARLTRRRRGPRRGGRGRRDRRARCARERPRGRPALNPGRARGERFAFVGARLTDAETASGDARRQHPVFPRRTSSRDPPI